MRPPYCLLAIFAYLILTAAAVWMGGLNQDEGWYLYAANLVRDGLMPYRDFDYTQGPLLPVIYSSMTWVWRAWGLLGARIATALIGLVGILFAVGTARVLSVPERRREAGLAAFLFLGCNLYHLYYTAIPKTYALASAFVALGFFLLAVAYRPSSPFFRIRRTLLFVGGFSLAMAAGARISLGLVPAVVGFYLLADFRRHRWDFLFFGLGGLVGLIAAYGPFVVDLGAWYGLVQAQKYHAARGGFDVMFTVGSLSRLVRWYLPVFIALGLALARPRRLRAAENPVLRLLPLSFLAVFTLQMFAPFPYEDYQVPVMGLLAVFTAVGLLGLDVDSASENAASASMPRLLLVTGLAFACAFGSPLLERWAVNGQDRFWPLKKQKFELAQLREVAREIEALDPGGKTLLTQDLYLAIETGRKVPGGLEMGPFSILTDEEWKALLEIERCPMAALSGYTFAIEPPACGERPIDRQMEYWRMVRRHYDLVFREEAFGQNATPLLVLKRKP